jgi:hypothetical protein
LRWFGLAEREHKRGHEGSRSRREELAMKKRKSPMQSGNEQKEEPVTGPEGQKSFRV